MTKKITLLGATGTIGKNTISLVKENPEKFSLETIIARNNFQELAKIASEVQVKKVAIADESKYSELRKSISDPSVKIYCGKDEINELSAEKTDLFISGAVGFCALEPTLAAIRSGTKIGLANKECLVCAGDILMKEARDISSSIIPIDSEHNSIYQVFDFDRATEVERIILTASGGPFRNFEKAELATVTPEMAVKHPNWDMGKKISVDSATMMNKGLEIIEAYYLFPVNKEQIDVIVHPQSIIHGIVTYRDGSMLAGMSGPDMKIPISYALGHPERISNDCGRISLSDVASLTFEKPDLEKFRCLKIAIDALESGQNAQIALNSANEVAVEAFLEGRIGFEQIANTVEFVIDKITASSKNIVDDLEEIFDIDKRSRIIAEELIEADGLKKVANR